MKQFEGYTALLAVKPNGDVFASNQPLTKPVNFADRPWFQRLLKTRDFIIGEYVIGRASGKPTVVLAYPVLDDKGQIKALLAIGLDLEALKKTVIEIKFPEGTSVSVIDNDGTILLRYPETEKFAGKSMPEVSIVKAIMEKREGVEEAVGLDGVPRLFGFTSLGKGVESIHVSVGIPRQIALADADRVMRNSLAILVLITGLALLAAWFVGGFFIRRPINRLLDTTKQLADGNLTVRSGSPYGQGEIGQLANAFDQMAESLEQREAERKQAEETLRRSEEETKQLAKEASILAEIGRIISSTLNIEEVYERFTEEVHKLIPVDRTAFTIINFKDRTATTVYESGIEIADRRPGEVFPLAGSATEKAEQAKSGLIIKTQDENEVAAWVPGLLPVFMYGIRSVMMIPLISRDQVIGVLNLQSIKPNAYTEKELRIAERVGNQIAGAIANAHFFRERIRTEKEMAALQEQLRQSQKMEAIGRLAGGIAHDFNNFLTVMRGHSQLALMELKEGDRLRESFEAIENATMKSANLVRQILAFSRRQVMEMIVLDLNNLLRGLEKMLRRIIGEDIELLTVLADDLGRVKVDPGQVEQVVLNLALNAKDAMPRGGKLTIETANVELDETYSRTHIDVIPGRYVMFSVSDAGVGMTPEVRERVFEPFFTTKEKGRGTGLGLYTVYGIVKQSGGDIWVYSEAGMGTTFKAYFPRVDEPLEKEKRKPPEGELPRGGETILAVEDNKDVRRMAAQILRRQGYRVLEAANGGEALLVCEKLKEEIHLLLTDVVMPGMSGRELAHRLSFLRPEMKILYMSGYSDDSIVSYGILNEKVSFIPKPFSLEALVNKAREVLDK